MNGITWTLRELHRGETDTAHLLTAVSNRHAADHEVRFGARDLARWSTEHAQRLADVMQDRSHPLAGPGRDAAEEGPVAALGEKLGHGMAGLLGRRPEPALLLLADLRRVYLAAAGNSLWWEMTAQAAQAARDRELQDLAADCHPQTLRQMRWADTLLKTLSPQALTSS